MQTCRGSGYGSGPAGKNRLVSFAVRGIVLAIDVRWKRHVAEPLNLRGYAARVAGSESDGAQAELAAPDDPRFHLTGAKHDALARFHLPPRTDQCLPYIGANLPGEQDFHRTPQVLLSCRT